jgi:hypothetical protein
MAENRTIPCPQCGAPNEVLVPDASFEDQLRFASFRFACRVCGADLPRSAAEPEETPDKP